LKINSFSITQQTTSWIYLDMAERQDFIVSALLLPHACEEFATSFPGSFPKPGKRPWERGWPFSLSSL